MKFKDFRGLVQTPKGVARKEAIVNRWQRGVPVYDQPLFTPTFWFLLFVSVLAIGISIARLFGGLGQYTGLSDAYAWGIWKTFSVMALTALGSGGLAIGIATWVFNRQKLHSVMRTALFTSFLFYSTGLFALAIDVGRPWNFYNMLFPWTWNTHSALFEVALAMPLYCFVFLLFENIPMFMEWFWNIGSDGTKARIEKWTPTIRKIYPYMIAGAYVIPMGHQSSLGALMMLAGDKVDPLWQTQMLPLLYLIQAGMCGTGFVIIALMLASLNWRRPLDMDVLGELGNIVSWLAIVFIGLRMIDIVVRGQLGHCFSISTEALLFHIENGLVFLPALVLRSYRLRMTPRYLFSMAVLACLGGLMYRFTPTTLAFDPGPMKSYFPAVSEVILTLGLLSLTVVLFRVAIRYLAILPAPMHYWEDLMNHLDEIKIR